jgi:hypothetical protein
MNDAAAVAVAVAAAATQIGLRIPMRAPRTACFAGRHSVRDRYRRLVRAVVSEAP